MRIAVISDIHGNLEALNTVLSASKELEVDRYICLGDIVGYGANPNECIDLVREWADLVIAGNHDHAAVGLTDVTDFNPFARYAALWTARTLTSANRDYLIELPLLIEEPEATFVHAEPEKPTEWRYIRSLYEASACLDWIRGKLCFIGHSHQPFMVSKEDTTGVQVIPYVTEIDSKAKYLINVGSVGQPRDHDERASFALWDRKEGTLEIVRVAYEIEKTQRKIRDEGLPPFLADRLAHGE